MHDTLRLSHAFKILQACLNTCGNVCVLLIGRGLIVRGGASTPMLHLRHALRGFQRCGDLVAGAGREWNFVACGSRGLSVEAGSSGDASSSGAARPREHGAGGAPAGQAGAGTAAGASGPSPSSVFPVYLKNSGRSVTRSDIVRFLADCGVTGADVHVEYASPDFVVQRHWVALASEDARERAVARTGSYLGPRRVQVVAAERGDLERATSNALVGSSRGRYVLLTGLGDGTSAEDVQQFFEGYDLLPRPITLLRDQVRALGFRCVRGSGAVCGARLHGQVLLRVWGSVGYTRTPCITPPPSPMRRRVGGRRAGARWRGSCRTRRRSARFGR